MVWRLKIAYGFASPAWTISGCETPDFNPFYESKKPSDKLAPNFWEGNTLQRSKTAQNGLWPIKPNK